MKKLPDIDIEELERLKKQNFEDRLKFIDMYAEWVKKNKNWSRLQKEIVDQK